MAEPKRHMDVLERVLVGRPAGAGATDARMQAVYGRNLPHIRKLTALFHRSRHHFDNGVYTFVFHFHRGTIHN